MRIEDRMLEAHKHKKEIITVYLWGGRKQITRSNLSSYLVLVMLQFVIDSITIVFNL